VFWYRGNWPRHYFKDVEKGTAPIMARRMSPTALKITVYITFWMQLFIWPIVTAFHEYKHFNKKRSE
jgi:hypothetical protein